MLDHLQSRLCRFAGHGHTATIHAAVDRIVPTATDKVKIKSGVNVMYGFMGQIGTSVMVAAMATVMAGAAITSQRALAQAAPAESSAVAFSKEELDQLMAPVALSPDTLLMQVLAASTSPLEVVAAQRFITTNSKLQGEALARAAANNGWDASVVSLLQFPSVLAMMNDKLEWTQKLGDAFLAQQIEVMDTVQALRARAQQAGNLQSNAQQNVVIQEKVIIIEPPRQQVVYVPYYNPTLVYGSWWWPARPPWVWAPPPTRPPNTAS